MWTADLPSLGVSVVIPRELTGPTWETGSPKELKAIFNTLDGGVRLSIATMLHHSATESGFERCQRGEIPAHLAQLNDAALVAGPTLSDLGDRFLIETVFRSARRIERALVYLPDYSVRVTAQIDVDTWPQLFGLAARVGTSVSRLVVQ